MSRKFTTKERWQVSIAISVFLIIALTMAGWLIQREKLVTIDTPLHKHSENHPAPYQDGVPHILLQESQDTWVPIRAKFIEGLLSEGNLYEQRPSSGASSCGRACRPLACRRAPDPTSRALRRS